MKGRKRLVTGHALKQLRERVHMKLVQDLEERVLGDKLDRIARYRRAVMDGSSNALTIEGECFRVDQDDDEIHVFWTGGLTEEPTELATLPADRFDANQSGDGWMITPKALPAPQSTNAPAMDSETARASRRAANDRLRDHLAERNQKARDRWGKPANRSTH